MTANVEIVINASDNTQGAFGGLLSNFGNLGNIVTGIQSAFNLAGQAIDAAVGIVQPFIDSASESEQAVARLDQVLRATGGAAGLTSEELQNMADELQGVTMFSDEAILAGQSMLLTFRNIGEDTFPRATEAMLDMGQMFGSVDAAAVQLGKALNDPIAGISALQRIGVTFSEEQRTMIENFMEMGDISSAQNVILTELESQIGGVAEAMGDTFAGQAAIFNNQLDSVRETIGGALLPILGEFLDMFQQGLPILQEWADTLARAITSGDFTELITRIQETFGSIDWSNLFQNAVDAVSAIDWGAISTRIAEGISSIDWARVGNIIAEGLGQLAIIIGTVISEINWEALLNSIGNAIADLMAGLFGFVDWEDMIANAEIGFRFVGQSIVDGLRDGLMQAWTNFTNLPNLLFNNFITSVKAVLGISSPSAVFADIGRDIVMGLIGGFTAYWDDLVRIATSSLDEFLNLFGIDISFGGSSASGLGTAGGGTAPGGGVLTSGTVTNNYYGPVYFGAAGEPGAYYDCPSPHPLVASSGNQLVATGF